jgi:hypothetical protein
MECIVCYTTKAPDEILPDTCCMRNVCRFCYRRWRYQNGGRCMICKRSLLCESQQSCPPYELRLDYSNMSNLLSSLQILFTTSPCVRCGVRLYRDGGCPNVMCTNCDHQQRHGETRDNYFKILFGDTWLTSRLDRLMDWIMRSTKNLLWTACVATVCMPTMVALSVLSVTLLLVFMTFYPTMICVGII